MHTSATRNENRLTDTDRAALAARLAETLADHNAGCGGMSAHLPSHALGPITDTLTFGRILAGRDPQTGAPR